MFAHPSRKLFLCVLVVILLLLATPHSAVTSQAEDPVTVTEFSAFNLCSAIPETVRFSATYRVFFLPASDTFQSHVRVNIQAHGVGELSGSEYTYYAQRWAFVYVPPDQQPVDQVINMDGVVLGRGQTADFNLSGVLHLIVTPDGIDLAFEPSADVECAAVYPAQPRF